MARPRQSLARAPGKQRDARLFVVATEDTFAPRQYFRFFEHARVVVHVLPSEAGLSSPAHVVQMLIAFERKYQLKDEDQLWALLDTDHWIEPNHKKGLLEAIGEARQRGFRVAMSNPCFDLWLLLHHEAVAAGTVFVNCDAVGARIRSVVGEYSKINLKAEHYPVEKMLAAIRRARALEPSLLRPVAGHYWPETTGTRVFLLMEELKSAGLFPSTP